MRYRELVEKERELCNNINTEKEKERLELILTIIQETFNKISVTQAMEIISKVSDSEIEYLSEFGTIYAITNPHQMAEILKDYEFECEEPPSETYWRIKSSYNSEKVIKVLYGNCTFSKILQKHKYISIYSIVVDSEEILQECDFELERILVVLVNEPPALGSNLLKSSMYIYLP